MPCAFEISTPFWRSADLAVEHRRVVVEDVEQQARARGQRAELGLEADQAARRDHVVEPHAALAVGLHAVQLAAAAAERRHDGALARVLDVDRERSRTARSRTPSISLMTTRGRDTASS